MSLATLSLTYIIKMLSLLSFVNSKTSKGFSTFCSFLLFLSAQRHCSSSDLRLRISPLFHTPYAPEISSISDPNYFLKRNTSCPLGVPLLNAHLVEPTECSVTLVVFELNKEFF
jgi:hypothetical protein